MPSEVTDLRKKKRGEKDVQATKGGGGVVVIIIMYSFMCYFSKLEHIAHYMEAENIGIRHSQNKLNLLSEKHANNKTNMCTEKQLLANNNKTKVVHTCMHTICTHARTHTFTQTHRHTHTHTCYYSISRIA